LHDSLKNNEEILQKYVWASYFVFACATEEKILESLVYNPELLRIYWPSFSWSTEMDLEKLLKTEKISAAIKQNPSFYKNHVADPKLKLIISDMIDDSRRCDVPPL